MRKFERHEIALGGCVREKDSPTESIRCGVCEFEFEPKSATWRRGSKDPDSFKPAISETLRSFTMPEPWSRGYGQAIYCDGEARESVTLIVLGKIAANETALSEWALSHGGELTSRNEAEKNKILFETWESRSEGWKLEFAGDSSCESFVTLEWVIKKANQALQHYDPSSHVSWLHTPRSSRVMAIKR